MQPNYSYSTIRKVYLFLHSMIKYGKTEKDLPKTYDPFLTVEMPDDLIVCTNTGNFPTSRNIQETLDRILRRCGLPHYGTHALRHTFATRCIEAGIQPVVLKGWLGHTNIHVTLDTYADVFDRMNLGAISKFEEYMDKVLQEEE